MTPASQRLLARIALFVGLAATAPGGVAAPPMPAPREIAITMDDLPWVEFGRMPDAEAARDFRRIVATLRAARVPATGFVNEDKLEVAGAVDAGRRQLLVDWLAAGLDLGNHTYGHVDLHHVDVGVYEAAVVKGEPVTRALLAARGRELTWFRHPYLHTGRSDEVADDVYRWLAERGYRSAPVTIDNGEWIYARAYLNAAADAAARTRIRRDYLRYMEAKTAYFEDESRRLLGREMTQILLIHANSLNADALPDLLALLRKRGYRYVGLDQATRDPAYRERPDRFRGAGGISWLHRWALTAKLPRGFFDGEPEVPKDILAQAGVDSE